VRSVRQKEKKDEKTSVVRSVQAKKRKDEMKIKIKIKKILNGCG